MLIEQTLEKLHGMKLNGMAEALSEQRTSLEDDYKRAGEEGDRQDPLPPR